MKNLLVIVSFLFMASSLTLYGQGTTIQTFFDQDPYLQASIVAEADDSIEEVVDENTGETYFIRQITNPWDGQTVSEIVVFDIKTGVFRESDLYALNGEEDNKTPQKPNPIQKDSCIQKKHNELLQNQKTVRPQPRRSSRVKLAEEF